MISLYYAGKVLQAMALLTMPSAIWIAHFERNEAVSITVFVASIAVFWLGYLLTRAGKPG